MEQAISDFSTAIDGLKVLTVVDVSLEDNHLTLLCRIVSGADATWIEQMKKLILFAQKEELNLICSKRYLTKGNQIVFAWCIEVSGEELESSLQKLAIFIPSLKKIKRTIYNKQTTSPQRQANNQVWHGGPGGGEIEMAGAPAMRNMKLVSETEGSAYTRRR